MKEWASQESWRLLWLAWLAVSLCQSSSTTAAEVTFRLVPSQAWADEPAPESVLDGGTVFLYEIGKYEPTLVVEANRPAAIPSGTWRWTAEAPGYVTVDSGTLNLSDASAHMSKEIYWPVVPACEFLLEEDPAWKGVERLDVVSLSSGAIYPINPRKRQRLWVPAGEMLAYSVGRGRLIGIRSLGKCAQNESKPLLPPSPPVAGYQALMVHAVIPEGGQLDRGELEAFLRLRDGAEPVRPDASVWWKNRGSFFFLNVPADDARELALRHPKLRSISYVVEPLGGSARELPEFRLKDRLDLSLLLDYRPKRPHQHAILSALYCGSEPKLSQRARNPCRTVVATIDLEEHVGEYVFKDLDDGLYTVRARIDDEESFGFGVGFFPFLDPESNLPPAPQSFLLWEMEIYGHLMRSEDPVPGEVRLLSIDRRLPTRRFPTDDDLLYHMFYFATPAVGPYRLPGEEDKDPQELMGLNFRYSFAACDEEERCRQFHPESIIRGEGRLDIELEGDRALEVQVVDAEDESPLEGAEVTLNAPSERLVFIDGELEWKEPASDQLRGVRMTTENEGFVRFAGLQEGEQRFAVRRGGYLPERSNSVVLPEMGVTRARVALKKEEATSADEFVFRFQSGEPIGNAFLLVIGPGGVRLPDCSTTTNSKGEARFKEHCLSEGNVVGVLHGGAHLSVFDGATIEREVAVARAPFSPLRLRVVDGHGQPIFGVPLELRFRFVTIGPQDLLTMLGKTGTTLFYTTDEEGEALLFGVDPNGLYAPEIAVPGEEDGVSLRGYQPGDTVELVHSRGP